MEDIVRVTMTDVTMKNFISLTDAAHFLGVTRFTLRNIIYDGNFLSGHLIDKELFFKKDEFEEVIEKIKEKISELADK